MNFSEHWSLEGLLKYRLLGLPLRLSDLGSPGWGLRICTANTFLGDADAVGRGPHFETTGLWSNRKKNNVWWARRTRFASMIHTSVIPAFGHSLCSQRDRQ